MDRWIARFNVANDGSKDETVVVGCAHVTGSKPIPYGGTLIVGTITDATSASWFTNVDIPCFTAAINPRNPDQIIYSNATNGHSNVYESLDRGKTFHSLNFPTMAYHVAIDANGFFYTGAEAGAYFSQNNGKDCEFRRACSRSSEVRSHHIIATKNKGMHIQLT